MRALWARRQRLLAGIGLVAFSVTFGMFSLPVGAVSDETARCANIYVMGVNGCRDYFSATLLYGSTGIAGENVIYNTSNPNGAWGIPANIDTAPEFEAYIAGLLGNNNSYTYNKLGAAMLVDTMLGDLGPSQLANHANGIANARSHLGQWESYVTAYAQQGRISWSVVKTLGPGTVNSLHSCTVNTANSNCTLDNMVAGRYDSWMAGWYRMTTAAETELSHEIIFTNPNGTTYVVRRECDNIIGGPTPLSPLQPPPSITATCGGVSVDPGRPDPGTPFTVTAAVNYSSAANASTAKGSGDKMFITVSGPGLSYNNADVTPITQNSSTLNGSANVPASGNTGNYTITYGMTGAVGLVNCTGSLVIADQPYVGTTGGDTGSGMGMSTGGTDCATPADPKGGIVSWNKGAAGGYAGAGTQYAALALNHLQDFATGQGSSLAPSGLAFANTSDGDVETVNGLFGGQFGSEACVPDYFANATNVQTGNITIGGQAVANGTHTTVYVKGNVYITGNITYSGSYASVADIPSYSIIVQGNIYIAPGVSQLDGLYVAEPTTSGGTTTGGVIYTCASGPFTAAALDANLYNACKTTSLTVNGSFIGQQVWLLRTAGTLSGSAAESFNFSPELWLSTPPASNTAGATTGDKYDAITSLPPVL